MKNVKKSLIALLMALALVVLAVPSNVFAAYPQKYDIIFKAGDDVVEEFKDVPYIESIVVPEYEDVETWYHADLDIEVKAGERFYAGWLEEDKEVVFQADTVLPYKYIVQFTLPDGEVLLEEDLSNWYIEVPDYLGEQVTWLNEEYGDVVTGTYLNTSYYDCYDFYELVPTITYVLENQEEQVKEEVKYVDPEEFTLRFVYNKSNVKEVVVPAYGWGAYNPINIPKIGRVVLENGEFADKWVSDVNDIELKPGDYVSGCTLDLDYLWTEEYPVITFNLK